MEQLALFEGGKNTDDSATRHMKKFHDYDAFVEKFEPKKTTDDCYTPPLIYEAIADWVAKEYGLNRKNFVRPFYPGGDYKTYEYNSEAVVVDNPPFSILSKIVKWYSEHGVKFFLFAPALTLGNLAKNSVDAVCLSCDCSITYDNGAIVNTSFITNLDDLELMIKTAPELCAIVNEANRLSIDERKKPEKPKYKYPANFTYAPELNLFSKLGIHFQLRKDDCFFVSKLDSQKPFKKTVFGGGFLISEKARIEAEKARIEAEKARIEAENARIEAEKARIEAEKARPRTIWELSEREKEIIRNLGKEDDQQKNETL